MLSDFMIFRLYRPGPPLDRYIEFFWFYEGWDGDHSRQHVVPDGTFEFVICLDDSPRRLFDPERRGPTASYSKCWLSGVHSRYLVIDTRLGGSMIGAHFRPGGAAPFLSTTSGELKNLVVQGDQVWGISASSLRDQMVNTVGQGAKFRLLERFFLGLLRQNRKDDRRQKRIDSVLEVFCREPNLTKIHSAAARLGLSHKHFIEEFEELVGLTPKLFTRIRRLQGALAQINRGSAVRWVDVAVDCGYYDQAHMIHDFQRFAGLKPSEYLHLEQRDSRFIARER